MGKIHDALQKAEAERARLGDATHDAMAETAAGTPRPSNLAAAVEPGIARVEAARHSQLLLAGNDTPVSEEYRTLRARIQSLRRQRSMQTIVVTSALPGEGKSTTASNLAVSMGLEREARTCLIDCDLRTPSIHQTLFDTPDAGIVEVLDADAKLDDALVRIPDTRLWLLTVRGLSNQPSELLGSRKMAELLTELRTRFDTILIDAPPVLGLPDATTLVDLCDAVLMVVGAGDASRSEIESALERIDGSKVIGAVFNRAPESSSPYGGYAQRTR